MLAARAGAPGVVQSGGRQGVPDECRLSRCGFLNPGTRPTAGGAAARWGRTCASCGAGRLPPELKYCTTCGAELDRPEPALERKIVSVVFVDVVGFTTLAEKLDPEDVRRIIDPYYACVRAELERYGGTVEKFIGDAVMALFGAPTAHEDDAERAVGQPTRCARRSRASARAMPSCRCASGSPPARRSWR